MSLGRVSTSGRSAVSGRLPALLASQMPPTALWLRSDFVALSSAGLVTTAYDLSGGGFNLTNSTGVPYTPQDPNFNNLPSLGGASNTAFLTGSKPSVMLPGSTSAEYFMVIRPVTAGIRFGVGWGVHNSTSDGEYFAFTGYTYLDDFCGNSGLTETRFSWVPSSVTSGTTIIYNAISNQTTWQANINGAVTFGPATNTFTIGSTNGITILGATSAINVSTTVAEVIVFPHALGFNERQFVKTYLSKRYNIAVV